MVLPEGIGPSTSPLPRECSTTELRQRRVSMGGLLPQTERQRNPPVDSTVHKAKMARMNRPTPPPENTKITQKAARKAKLAKALKANIKRRKASPQDNAKT